MVGTTTAHGVQAREEPLGRLLAVVRARWRLIAALMLPVLALSWGYVATLQPAYTARVVLSFAPEEGTPGGQTLLSLIARYEIAATTPQALRDAEREAGLPDGALSDGVSAELDDLELELEATTSDPGTSEVAAGALADVVTRQAGADPLVDVWTTIPASSGGDETPLRRVAALLAGLVLAPLPGVVLALMLEGSRPRVRTLDDMSELGMPVLQSLSRRKHQGEHRPAAEMMPKPPLQLWLALSTVLGRDPYREGRSEIAVVSVGGAEDDAELVVQHLTRTAKAVRGEENEQGRARFHVLPWRSASDARWAEERRAHERSCVLVVRSGVPQDEVRAAAGLLDACGMWIVGSVLLTP